MDTDAWIAQLAGLLREVSQQMEQDHGAAPLEWPLIMAELLHPRLGELLSAQLTKSMTVYLLVQADLDQKALAPGADWPSWYAGWLAERYKHNRPGLS
ncbi:MAG: hypothetical protein VX899_06875 [Myxococcota bacterium]|nr:hypothetical protein [Myxococcota bacterium]